eukprot:TRINITY_DN3172_c0_g1_i3.p1 TRINITY_DN3172_c0_g1~~TRINITY_DN3172_c0_g1_i3.p1  ORF type:complete len:262 (-),score=32.49 TRINITY_DN3172_c0_g1_i3:192-977(-)
MEEFIHTFIWLKKNLEKRIGDLSKKIEWSSRNDAPKRKFFDEIDRKKEEDWKNLQKLLGETARENEYNSEQLDILQEKYELINVLFKGVEERVQEDRWYNRIDAKQTLDLYAKDPRKYDKLLIFFMGLILLGEFLARADYVSLCLWIFFTCIYDVQRFREKVGTLTTLIYASMILDAFWMYSTVESHLWNSDLNLPETEIKLRRTAWFCAGGVGVCKIFMTFFMFGHRMFAEEEKKRSQLQGLQCQTIGVTEKLQKVYIFF